MRNAKTIAAVAAALLLCGCSILAPKRVEFFQDKVQAFPEATAKENELQRQVAFRTKEKAEETLEAAIRTDAAIEVVVPAKETAVLADAVSDSLGPPLKPAKPSQPSDELAVELRSAIAKLNARIDKFQERNDENAGKKIEGTGTFSIGYFSMWLWILAGVAVLWFGLKMYGMVNPVVGLGTNIVGRVSSGLLKKSVAEVTEGGEWFKEYLKESKVTEDVQKMVLDLFNRAQVEAQSRDTQTLIAQLTKK